MGLFSKLFGGNASAEKAAKGLLQGLFGEKQNETGTASKPEEAAASETFSQNNEPAPAAASDAPSGFSWGPVMPAEENQYNYNGPFTEYFEKIFHGEFADLRLERKDPKGQHAHVYTFYDAAGKVLVVELLSRSSSAKKVRETCRTEGTPYLRFYFDYEGWWNTRAYVVKRMKTALGRQ